MYETHWGGRETRSSLLVESEMTEISVGYENKAVSSDNI